MVIEEVKPAVPAALVSDLSGLVKSLQSLKAVHLRYIESKANGVFPGGDQNWRCLTVESLMGYVEDCLTNLKVLKW